MKKNLKYLLLLFAATAGFAACSDDDTADIQGIQGDFAYIVGGNEALYRATTCEVFHTPDAEEGSVEMEMTVALTRKQSSDVVLTLAVDNTLVDDTYEVIPDGVLNFTDKVTIPAGETKAGVSVTIDSADFPKLTQPQYLVPIVITSASGVQISTISNAAYLIVITETIDPADNLVSVKDATHKYLVKNYTNETNGDTIEATVTIEGTVAAYRPFDIELQVDNSLVAAYNEANGTSFSTIPSNLTVEITTATMETGAKSTSATVSVPDSDRSKLTSDDGYLIPVVLKSVGSATDNGGVVYLTVEVRNFDFESNFFSALYLGDYNLSTWYQFSKPINFTRGYSYVFHIFIDEITRVSRIGDFADINENWINMLRFGQKGDYDTRLEWFVGPNGCRKQLYTPKLEANTWYQVALVYTVSSYQLYVECELVDEYELTDADKETMAGLVSPTFQAIEFNSSWGANYREGNEFHGRLWEMAIFPIALDGDDLSSYCYHGYPDWLINGYGSAHWTFDEGVGYICYDTSGKYENIDFSKTIRCDDESSMVSADVSAYVQWKADQYNSFE